MSRKISRSLISGRAGAGTGGQGLKIDWFKTNLGQLFWRDVSESVSEYYLGGTNYGYCAGGYDSIGAGADTDAIDKWSLSSDADATDVGNLTRGLGPSPNGGESQTAGSSSSTHGYVAGGIRQGVEWYDIIEKWTFASDANATDVANLTAGRMGCAGVSSPDYGFVMGGGESGDTIINKIEKYTFAADANATDVGDITVARQHCAGASSATHGYCIAGWQGSHGNIIDKVSTSSDGNATDVGDLADKNNSGGDASSTTHGYCHGGNDENDGYIDTIQKFSFSADYNATDAADLTRGRGANLHGASSTTHGYNAGGKVSYGGGVHSTLDIDKYAFASDANATDVGDLVTERYNAGGCQF